MTRVVLLYCLAAAATIAIACSDLGDPVPLVPECNLSVSFLDFGEVSADSSADRAITITNTGNGDLNGKAVLDSPDFFIMNDPTPFVLSPGESRDVVVRYSPSDSGSHDAMLAVSPFCAPVLCTGTAAVPVEGAQCVVSPSSLSFGTVVRGSSAVDSVYITNTGSFTFGGTVSSPCSEFEILSGAGAFSIGPLGTYKVVVRFTPTENGDANCVISTGVNCSDIAVDGSGSGFFTYSFAGDVQPIFTSTCATAACHSNRIQQAGLDLSPGNAYDDIVNVNSTSIPSWVRVAPGAPSESLLFQKMGIDMPPPSGASQAHRDIIEVWIQEGAPNN